jgi:hypothetical protein
LSSGDALRYNKYDTLANLNDFSALYEVLSKFKDKKNKSPVFTAVSVVANPNFEKIRQNKFKNYYWEPFTETLGKYGQANAFDLWKQGIESELFLPQFHGREHLNIAVWMRALQENNEEALLAFDQGIWGFINQHKYNIDFQAAFDLENNLDLEVQSEAISTGLELFEQLFGYKATFFVPPNGPFNNSLEKIAFDNGIKYMSASKKQLEPQGNDTFKTKFHWLGQKNKWNQYYITRNCFFEPSDNSKDWVDSCLFEISNAFMFKKPAVISTHRVNYIGSLNEKNRINGLKQLEQLLKTITQKWPEVEFITSNQLGDMMSD